MTAFASMIFLLIFLSVTAEAYLGSFGIALPFSAMAVFYISGLYGWRAGIIAGIVAGAAIDLLYGRNFPLSSIPLACISGLAFLWTIRGSMNTYLMQIIPGAATGLLVSSEIFLHGGEAGFQELMFKISQICFIVLATAIVMPLFLWVLDHAAAFFGFEKLCGIKTEITTRTDTK